ncbi:MAG: alpha/beta fold hydrolase [Sandaracinaceae bacterium]|nr:alpha/beta fold hydrolase [Sandaracinaceae bacterium]
MRRALVAFAVLALGGCAAIYQVQSDFLYQPSRATTQAPPPPDAEVWWREVDGARVEAWFLPPTAAREGPAPAVVFAHGNRERIDEWPERLAPYRAMGLAVLLPEYRSYGRSGGEPSEAAIVEDFAHFVDRLGDRDDVDAQRLVFHGRSLGGGVAGVLAAERRCAALVLESSFTNVPDLASHAMAPAAAIRDRFDARAVAMRSDTPTLILHGVHDEVVPFRHAVELDRVAWDSRLVAFEAGHDVPRERAYWRSVRELLEAAGVL